MLGYPSPDVQFILDTDASNFAVGAVLWMGWRVYLPTTAAALIKLRKTIVLPVGKELLAAVKAIRHFHPYLLGRPFILRTDHDGLSFSILQKVREPGGFSSMIIKSNTNKELNTTMLIHSQEGLVPETYADNVIGWIKRKSI